MFNLKSAAIGALMGLTAVALATSSANAVTIGFDGEVPGVSPPISEAGFTLTDSTSPTSPSNVFGPSITENTNGTNGFGWCGFCIAGQTLTLTEDSGALFSFLSFEATNLDTGFFTPGMAIQVTGNLGAGGTVSQSFALVADTFTTFILGSGFTGLSSVEFIGTPFPVDPDASFIFDNLEVVLSTSTQQVSEPATIALFGLGLAGLGYMRRRRAA